MEKKNIVDGSNCMPDKRHRSNHIQKEDQAIQQR